MISMDISRRVMAPLAVFQPDEYHLADVDADGLIRNLLLFDQFVLISVRLEEFPFLIRRLGYEAVKELMFRDLIEIRYEVFQLGEMGKMGFKGSGKRPLYSYWFNSIDMHNRESDIEKALGHIDQLPLRSRQRRLVKDEIREAIRPLPIESKKQA